MTLLDALILGFIQGATEFLPVSSSGHLVMGQALLGINIPGVAFEVAVHLATLASVLLVYRRRVGDLLVGAFKLDSQAWRYLGLLILATLPAAVLGLTMGDLIEGFFEAPAVAGGALLVTGTFLWTSRWALARNPAGKPGARSALLIGLAQAFALVPGISRSGATVVAGLWLGLEAEEAAAFSFLMAIPAISGAAVLQIPELGGGSGGLGVPALLLGSGVAALVGVLAIWTFVAMLKRKAFHRFGPYCWGVGLLFLLYLFLVG
ncbi:undecaprenyl-diphosphate phosphatase [Gemmatimonadota bacterium]